jgi:hypothetical protein
MWKHKRYNIKIQRGEWMYQAQVRTPPKEVLDGLLAACLIVGLFAGVVFGVRLYNSIVTR